MAQAMANSRPVGSVFWPVVRRFAWKEIRATWGLALGAAGILFALLTLVSTIYWSTGESISPQDSEVFFIMAGTVSALYTVAASITAFSAERELRTHTFLFQMPHYWVAMGLGKLLAIVTAALVVAVVLGNMAIAFAGGIVPDDLGTLVRHLGVFLGEAVAWGLLVSLVCPQPLVGAVIASAMVSLGPYFVTGHVVTNQYIQLPEHYEAAPQRLMVAAVLMVINVALVRRWIEQAPEQGRARRPGMFRRRREGVTRDAALEVRPGTVRGQMRRPSLAGLKLLGVSPYACRTRLVRLVWHAWRIGWGRMLSIVVAAGAFVAFLYLVVPGSSKSLAVVPIAVGTVILPALLGSVVFGGDQREGRYEFLAQHGASPGRVWLSRVLVWLVPVVLVLMILAVVVSPEIREEIQEHYHWIYLLTGLFMTALTAFALGQLASLWIKSEIRAAGAAVAFMVLLVIWSPIAGYWRISPWWSLLPTALGALVATRIDIRSWMNNRRDSVSWGKSVAAALVPVAIVVGTVPLVRNWQIEWALRQVPAQYVTALHQQREELTSRRGADSRVATRYTALAEQLEAGEPLTREQMAELRELTKEQVYRLRWLLFQPTAGTLAREFRLQGHRAETLDEAWENYLALYRFRGQMLQEGSQGIQEVVNRVIDRELDLATFEFGLRPGQTPERLESAIDDLHEADTAYPPIDRGVVSDYIETHNALDGADLEEMSTLSLLHFLPGEEARARKALDVAAAIAKEKAEGVYAQEPPPRYFENVADYLPRERLAPYRTASSSPAVDTWWPPMWSIVERTADAREEQARRGLEKVRLALVAYHLRHGEYPPWLAALPMDIDTLMPDWGPHKSVPVEFAPQGHDLPIVVRVSQASTHRRIDPATPVLWIGGSYARLVGTKVSKNDWYDGVDTFVLEPLYWDQRTLQVVITLPRSENYPTPTDD